MRLSVDFGVCGAAPRKKNHGAIAGADQGITPVRRLEQGSVGPRVWVVPAWEVLADNMGGGRCGGVRGVRGGRYTQAKRSKAEGFCPYFFIALQLIMDTGPCGYSTTPGLVGGREEVEVGSRTQNAERALGAAVSAGLPPSKAGLPPSKAVAQKKSSSSRPHLKNNDLSDLSVSKSYSRSS
jgi:hypothetical protein